ncbi:MAG: hypothetical protein J0G28_08935 [Afipia sp.]|nr:hypothetical protein [Afipia sp.]OJW61913.1 MAG: hypothetical protein BGO65_01810 [Afipia sp. 64-13]
MCILCSDEKTYAAYMEYLDAMERAGKITNPDEAVDAIIEALQHSQFQRRPGSVPPPSFSCDPVDE